MKNVQHVDDIPAFANEAEEDAFWSEHELGAGLLEALTPVGEDELPPPRSRTRPVAVRFDEDVLRRLKAVARIKHKGYQTLLKEFVVERLYEEEKRERLVG